ncbi:MAG TPA: DUF6282 family protein [Rhizomicrobium sp.]|jgi:hypothetical protein|nr:DUF6282 family protein [Rhizomicrobium sp.]
MRKIALCIGLMLLAAPAAAQPNAELNLKGAIDFHVHQAPDSVARAISADDVARMGKAMGMRGMVMKNHWEPTASLAYMVRRMVPGIEIFGGVTQDLAVGGINPEAVKHMAAITGGYGRVVWLPTFDNDTPAKRAKGIPYVQVSEGGKLLPGVLKLLDFVATQPQLVMESGHVSPEEGLMMVHEAHARGIRHIVITHAMVMHWTIPQMQEAARDGAYMEFVYHATLGLKPEVTVADYAKAMKAVGPEHCIMATDLGDVHAPPPPPYPLEPQGFLDFMVAMNKAGISVADINLMSKTNPALALGLPPL